ncbi:MAG TPA: hypothetical protein VFE66_04810 [Bacteroidales bacterium]|nr:hypothetical protein [Bacteroidales bacterium]
MIVFCVPLFALPQIVDQDLTNSGIYDFMDELANLRIIDLTFATKMDVSYEFINNAYVSLAYQYLNITGDPTLSPPIFQGHQNIISGGINIGF